MTNQEWFDSEMKELESFFPRPFFPKISKKWLVGNQIQERTEK